MTGIPRRIRGSELLCELLEAFEVRARVYRGEEESKWNDHLN